jgi:hypothetical protein
LRQNVAREILSARRLSLGSLPIFNSEEQRHDRENARLAAIELAAIPHSAVATIITAIEPTICASTSKPTLGSISASGDGAVHDGDRSIRIETLSPNRS